MDEAYGVIGDRATRNRYDEVRQRATGIVSREISNRLRAELLRAHKIRTADDPLAALMEMIRIERRAEFERINDQNSATAEGLAREGVNDEERRRVPPKESDRHHVMRQVLIQEILNFLSRNPTVEQTISYRNAVCGEMPFPNHRGYGFSSLAIRAEDFKETIHQNRLLEYIRDHRDVTEEQFRERIFPVDGSQLLLSGSRGPARGSIEERHICGLKSSDMGDRWAGFSLASPMPPFVTIS